MTSRDALLLVEARHAAQSGRGAVIREGAGLSRREVALACGLAPSTICRWEARERVPQGRGAIRWARLLRSLADLADTRDRDAAGSAA